MSEVSKPHSESENAKTVRYYLNIVAEEDAHADAIAALDGLLEQLEAMQRVVDQAWAISALEATGTWPDFQPLADALVALQASAAPWLTRRRH